MTEKTPGETKHQHCSVCGFDNPEDVLNCKDCGTPLVASGRSHAEARRAAEATPTETVPEKPLEITNQPTEPKPADPAGQQAPKGSSDSTPTPASPTPP